MKEDLRWMAAAAALSLRGRPLSRPNPSVGALIVKQGCVVGRGFTATGGRPHAEAQALAMAGEQARGGTLYVTLEPCAHISPRGPSCADLVSQAGLDRVVIGCLDPDPRTSGLGMARVKGELLQSAEAKASLSGYLSQRRRGRPEITLKLALSIDGCIAMPNGESQWITGPQARAHGHMMRAMSDAILVGGETLRADQPRLDVRLPGLVARSPERWVLTRGAAPTGWHKLASPDEISSMRDVQYLLIEGGAGTAAAFLQAGLVDRLLIYRAPIILGGGRSGISDIGLESLGQAHGQWQFLDRRELGIDTLEVYSRIPCLLE